MKSNAKRFATWLLEGDNVWLRSLAAMLLLVPFSVIIALAILLFMLMPSWVIALLIPVIGYLGFVLVFTMDKL